MQNLSDVKINILIAGRLAGQIQCSLEAVDAAPLLIPKRILNKIRNSQSDSVEIAVSIEQIENNNIGGITQ